MDTCAATASAGNPAGIIGGMFGLEEGGDTNADGPGFLSGPHLAMVNARSALRLAIARLAPRQTWFPSYFCNSLLAALEGLPTELRLFEIDGALQIASAAWLDELQPGDVVVLIEYFGFPCDETWIERIHGRGAVVIMDACQSLLSDHSSTKADMIVYSPRKFIGVPDGGVLQLRTYTKLADVSLAPASEDWLLLARQAGLGRRDFDRSGGDRQWFRQFQAVEASQPVGNFAMSALSRDLLGRLDYAEVIRRRRENYSVLLSELERRFALLGDLPPGVVPLGFPVRLAERERLRQALFAQQIYPPIHWPLASNVPSRFAGSHRLANEQLTLPCDQRYTVADMRRVARVVRQEAGA